MTATASPWRIERYDSVASTSDICVERTIAGDPGRLLVIAAAQTAGRGRAGRTWASPQGNFYASALIRPNVPAGQGGRFALMAGLALLEAIDQVCGSDAALSLKWPNDIMAGRAKLAGILLDATIEAGRIATMVIGFGVNMAFAPVISGRATTCLAELGLRIVPDDLASALCARLDHWQSSLADNGALRTGWMRRAHPPGSEISVDAGRVRGIYAGIDADGALQLRQGSETTIIRSGDVSLL